MSRIVVFSGNAHKVFATAICRRLGQSPSPATISRFGIDCLCARWLLKAAHGAMRASLSLGFLLGFLFLSSAWARTPAQCHYRYSVWNVEKTTSVKWISVAKPYGELTAKERGPFDCTPCLEDQAEVALSNGLRFKACGRAADKIKGALEAALSGGDRIETIVAYRAQMSRGPIDRQGNRTELSNHSFGVAVDVNLRGNDAGATGRHR